MRARKLTAALVAVPVLLAGAIGAAHADNLKNDVTSTAGGRAITIESGNQATVTYSIEASSAGGGGYQGCDATAASPVTVSINTPTGVTAQPSSLVFSSCSTLQSVTFSSSTPSPTAGYAITHGAQDDFGIYNTNGADFTLHVTAATPSNTKPSVSISGVTDGASYAVGSVPTAMCDVTDVEDGSSSFAAALSAVTGPYAADGIGQQTATCSYTDRGGLPASSASATYSIVDPSAPEISYTLNPASPDGKGGWYQSDVTLTWTVTEDESPSSLQKTGCVDQAITADQAETSYTCSASSAGGSATEKSVSIKRDATAPVDITFVGGPTGDFYYGNHPGAPTCEASDLGSGLDTCEVTGGGSTVGTHSYVATATDLAGNVSTRTLTYEVKPWTTTGFYAPVDLKGVLNTVKGGSTVPLKFEVFADTELTDTSVVASFKQVKVTCGGSPMEDPVEVTTTGGTSLRYDATAGQFIQNWQTPKGSGTCHVATVTFTDGSSISANFKLK